MFSKSLEPPSSDACTSPTAAIFSDPTTRPSSPPSSPPDTKPPAAKQTDAPQTLKHPTRNAFSILGKRPALQPIQNPNGRAPKRASSPATRAEAKKPKAQMQLSYGQQTQKRCKTCGMEYVPSSAEDRKLHDVFHRQATTAGYAMPFDFVQKLKLERSSAVVPGVNSDDGSVCVLDGRDSRARRKIMHAVLDIVTEELGAVEIGDTELWADDERQAGRKRYAALLYVRDGTCVGFLLAERIRRAQRVEEPSDTKIDTDTVRSGSNALAAIKARRGARAEAAKKPLRLSTKVYPALLGISRVWTSPTHRGRGIAKRLLDVALAHLSEPRNEERPESKSRAALNADGKALVAFSQPTEAGRRLATAWFGRTWGWKVYAN